MPAASLRPPRPALALVGGMVLLLHALLLVLLASLGTWRDRGPAEKTAPPLTVWLLDDKPSAAATPAARVPSTAVQLPSALPRPQRADEPGAITVPALPTPPAPATPASAPALVAERPAAAASDALNLALPRGALAPWRQRNPALDDARANTRRPTHMAALIDRALGGDADGPITEEALSDGSRRFRRGSRCVVIHPSQTQRLDPFHSSFSPKPGVVDSC